MKLTHISEIYNLKIVSFLLYRSSIDLEKLLECAGMIIQEGIGSAHLDKITYKKFTDREDDYYKRICKEVESKSKNIEYLFLALIEWYQSWEDEYRDFNEDTCFTYFECNNLKTWTYCILNGNPELFVTLSDEYTRVLTKEELKNLELVRSVSENLKMEKIYVNRDQQVEDFEEQFFLEIEQTKKKEIYNNFITEFKKKVFNKRIIFVNNSAWSQELIENLKEEYGFFSVLQRNAIEVKSNFPQCDYIIFCTSEASHAVYEQIKRKYKRNKLFLVKSINIDSVMKEFMEQLEGYKYES